VGSPRRRTLRERSFADEERRAGPPKSLELETRIGRLETRVRDLCETVEVLKRKVMAQQAQMDHFVARIDRR
jgi:hypothetical protein